MWRTGGSRAPTSRWQGSDGLPSASSTATPHDDADFPALPPSTNSSSLHARIAEQAPDTRPQSPVSLQDFFWAIDPSAIDDIRTTTLPSETAPPAFTRALSDAARVVCPVCSESFPGPASLDAHMDACLLTSSESASVEEPATGASTVFDVATVAPRDVTVQCPVCTGEVTGTAEDVEHHIDECLAVAFSGVSDAGGAVVEGVCIPEVGTPYCDNTCPVCNISLTGDDESDDSHVMACINATLEYDCALRSASSGAPAMKPKAEPRLQPSAAVSRMAPIGHVSTTRASDTPTTHEAEGRAGEMELARNLEVISRLRTLFPADFDKSVLQLPDGKPRKEFKGLSAAARDSTISELLLQLAEGQLFFASPTPTSPMSSSTSARTSASWGLQSERELMHRNPRAMLAYKFVSRPAAMSAYTGSSTISHGTGGRGAVKSPHLPSDAMAAVHAFVYSCECGAGSSTGRAHHSQQCNRKIACGCVPC